jgi:lipid II isoglutaminyl synthase (glutamine-hydrolysing)
VSPPAPSRSGHRLPVRSRIAVALGRLVGALSRLTHLGSGSVIGGRVALLVDPRLLHELTTGREVALVSATNGKTTTTRLLVAALATSRSVASNTLGANMPPGHVAALSTAPAGATAVLEVDERWLGRVMSETRPMVVLLLNLSRDQLDRSHEVRDLAARWHEALRVDPPHRVIANADDPLVAWAASAAEAVTWVGAGATWREDAAGCPACGGRLRFDRHDWWCAECALRRPEPEVMLDPLDDRSLVLADSSRLTLDLVLPGRVNRANAAMALAAARAMGVDPPTAVDAMRSVRDVAGRYRAATVDGSAVRLLLAKNPAGWLEALDMIEPDQPVIVSINARVADGHDPSWLWDVPFERLRGRQVVATGERRRDLAVRLHYAEVGHVVAGSLREAVRAAGAEQVDVAANYTAFQEYLEEVGR